MIPAPSTALTDASSGSVKDSHTELEVTLMKFVLHYRGSLPAATNNNSRTGDKHRIRLHFDRQLRELVSRKVAFEHLAAETIPHGKLAGGALTAPLDHNGNKILKFAVPLAGYELVTLLTRPHRLAAEIDITWLRREEPGHVVTGGDLDNRLKTLFDAMRMPHTAEEIAPSLDEQDELERLYCLLEDDSMITRCAITTHELLEPPKEGEKQNDVDLTIHVTVVTTFPSMANMVFS